MQNWDMQLQNQDYNKASTHKKGPQSFYPTKSFDSKMNYLDITALIRSLQRADGETDCFRTSIQNCPIKKCRWRQYCFEK